MSPSEPLALVCPVCGGDGYFSSAAYLSDGTITEVAVVCEACGGTGEDWEDFDSRR